MSNYVWSKIICSQEVFDKIVMDSPTNPSHSIISFHKILGVDYDDREARNVLVVKNADDTYELKYCHRWFYPITCITRLIETFHDVVWYLVEENHIYVSKFYWDNGVKEDVMDIEYQYYDWLDENPIFGDDLDFSDDDVWYFLKTLKENWINWESTDNYARYLDIAAYDVDYPFKNRP